MFDIAWTEILVVLVVAMLVTKPSDYPKIISWLRDMLRKFNHYRNKVETSLNNLANQHDLAELKKELSQQTSTRNIRHIIDLEGNIREAYDITELEKLKDLGNKFPISDNKKTTIH